MESVILPSHPSILNGLQAHTVPLTRQLGALCTLPPMLYREIAAIAAAAAAAPAVTSGDDGELSPLPSAAVADAALFVFPCCCFSCCSLSTDG